MEVFQTDVAGLHPPLRRAGVGGLWGGMVRDLGMYSGLFVVGGWLQGSVRVWGVRDQGGEWYG